MDNDWQECLSIDHHLNVMTIKANTSHFCSNAMFIFYVFSGTLFFLGDYAFKAVYLARGYNISRSLPIKIQLPFETEQSPIYELFVVIIALHGLFNTCTFAVINGLISTLVSFTFHRYICN